MKIFNSIRKGETKMTKKKVFVVALALCLVAIISFGTLAWFTAQDSVTNEFYVGDSTTDPDNVFGIDVWEVVDEEEIGKGTAEDKGATYENILPGEKLSKEPYLTNTGVHPQYVRAIVTVSEATLLREAMEGAWGDADLFLAGTHENWTLTDILFTDDDELVYVYYYNHVLTAGATTDALFEEVVIPTGMTLDQAQAMENFTVSILGQAIQSEHLADPDVPGEMVATAQRAFELYWDEEGTVAGYTEEEIRANGKANGTTETTVYIDIVDPATSEISLTNETITVSEAVVKVDPAIYNATVIIDGCDLTVAEGGYICYFGSSGGMQVIITSDSTVNGVAVGEMDKAELMKYFHNIGSEMVWVY